MKKSILIVNYIKKKKTLKRIYIIKKKSKYLRKVSKMYLNKITGYCIMVLFKI